MNVALVTLTNADLRNLERGQLITSRASVATREASQGLSTYRSAKHCSLARLGRRAVLRIAFVETPSVS